MKKIIALGGSNSKESINKKLALYTAQQLVDVEVLSIDLKEYELPLYSIDRENEEGVPELALQLNQIFKEADGFVVSLAEHNGSYSVGFKNTFDWLSRIEKEVWKGKPMFLMATSPGARGGQTVLETAKMSFPHLGAKIAASFSLPQFFTNFSDESGIQEEDLKQSFDKQLALFKNEIH
ncbi:NADPH-dependent FMN reductase [Aquimarina rhabdastrellae]